jgi:hypothetical protein
MKRYKKMNAIKLAELILEAPFDEEIAFAYDVYKEGILDGELTESDLLGWYGFKKLKAMDSMFIVINRYGGECLYCFEIIDYEKGAEEHLLDYFDEHNLGEFVYVELED